MKKLIFPLLLCSMTAAAQNKTGPTGQYPVTRSSDQKDQFFGTTVPDPYRWLEDDRSAETGTWVKAQNKTTDAYLAQIPYRDAIRKRLTTLWNYEKYGAPFKEGGVTYFYKNDGLQNQSVLYRTLPNGGDEVFLDPNKFSADGTTSLSGLSFTKDGSLVGYQISEGGSDWGKAIILDAKTKQQIGETMTDLKFSGIAWKGNEGFYYSTYDKPKGSQLSAKTEHHKLYYHKLGTAQKEDKMIFGGDQMPRRYIGGGLTEDEHYLVISAANSTSGNELYIKDLTKPDSKIIPIITGFDTELDVVYNEGSKLFISTNLKAPNRKLVIVDAATPTPESWKTLIPETKFPLTVSTCGGKLFAQYIQDAVSKVYQYSTAGKQERSIELPGLGTASGFGGKKEEQELFYSFTSYVYPTTIFRYNIASGKSEVYKRPKVAFDPSQFESKQVFYPSKDGAVIPMILTYKKGLKHDEQSPLLLYGYGGFNISLTPSFSVSNLVFMEAGGIYAVANLRGGGEYGDTWHNAGIKMQKQNVFDDFISAAEYLIAEHYTSKERLAIAGGSNGGLLVGASITQRPDLYKVAFPQVGVLDMLRYHKFTAGAGWAYDYGTADDSKAMFDYLYKYSPVHNVKKGACYPATLVMTGDHDDRVVPAHSFKFAAALQAAQNCGNPTLIRIETKAGHGAGKPTAMLIDEQADKWAFLFWNMGLGYK